MGLVERAAACNTGQPLRLEIVDSPDAAAAAAAAFIAALVRDSVARRPLFTMALSGGSTPVSMLDALAVADLPWESVHIFQTDERVAPPGDPDRNLTQLRTHLVDRLGDRPAGVYPMPVEDPAGLEAAALAYGAQLREITGAPSVLDLVHLGLGDDGHTASLVPGDPVLDVTVADVGCTGLYHGRSRMTLTFPVLERARCIVWLVTGMTKADVLARVVAGDTTTPAGRVARHNAILFADRAAAFVHESSEATP
jgi:6-phosphogluconolactonase